MKYVSLKKLNAALLVLAAVVSADGVANENQYRWLNDRGEPIYSDRPPPEGVDYEVISTESTLKRVVPGEQGAVPLETKPSVSNNFKPVDSAEEGRSKKNPELCEKAKMNLVALDGGRPLKVRNDKGEVKELSPEEREIAKQDVQELIETYCD